VHTAVIQAVHGLTWDQGVVCVAALAILVKLLLPHRKDNSSIPAASELLLSQNVSI
jgi:hypothetical protein